MESNTIVISDEKKKSSRCYICKLKLGYSGGTHCRCGNIFCSSHIGSDDHSCSYDYRILTQSTLTKQLKIPDLIATGRYEKI